MVWAGICHDVRTQLIIVQGTLNAVKYRDDIIVLSFCPFCNSETLITSFNAQDSLAVLWRCLKIGHTTGLLARSPDSRSLLRTV
jgi:hypothetical protein